MNSLYREVISTNNFLVILYGDDSGYFELKDNQTLKGNLKFASDIPFDKSVNLTGSDPTHELISWDCHLLPTEVQEILENRGVYLH